MNVISDNYDDSVVARDKTTVTDCLVGLEGENFKALIM
jgi:hypothetical protein